MPSASKPCSFKKGSQFKSSSVTKALKKSVSTKKKTSKEHIHVEFGGFNSSKDTSIDFLRVDESGVRNCIRWMDDKDAIVIPDQKVVIRFELEFDKGPFNVSFATKNKSGFTRQKLASKIAAQYQKMFQNKSRYGSWVRQLNKVGILSLSGQRGGVFTFDVDIN